MTYTMILYPLNKEASLAKIRSSTLIGMSTQIVMFININT